MDNDNTTTVQAPSIGLAVASLTLGIVAVFMSFLVIGILAGLLGLVFGWIQLARRRVGRGIAIWGVVLSLLGMAAGGGFVGLYYQTYQKVKEMQGGGGDEPDFAAWHGKAAPEIEVTTLDGKTLKLSELKGRRVVLDFWATWCPPCRMEIPHFVQLSKENPADQLLIVGISSEDGDTLRDFAQKNGVNYPMASKDDEDLPEPYSLIRAIPTTFFIDRNGIIQNVEVGYTDLDELRKLALAPDEAAPATAPAAE